MTTQTIVLNFEGTKTENEIYQILLQNIDQMIIGAGNNVELLASAVSELKSSLALAENRHYQALQKCHEDFTTLSLKSAQSRLDLEQANLVSEALK